jgi:hypothetical protein
MRKFIKKNLPMKSKYLVIFLMMLLVGCDENKISPEAMYRKNALELSSLILSSEENNCNCVLRIENKNESLLEKLQAENPSLKKETLKKELGIDDDTIFDISDKLSKSFELSDSIFSKYNVIEVAAIIGAKRDSIAAKRLIEKCPHFWINLGPAIFNEDYSKAVIPINVGIGGSLDVYYKIDKKWKFVKSIVNWIS